MEEKEIRYEYRGNVFYLEPVSVWYGNRTSYTLRGIEIHDPRLYLPDACQGSPVTRWYPRDKNPLPEVRFLALPSSLTEIMIENALFPDLEKVEVQAGHSKFSTDGLMLFSKDGRELLYSLAAGFRDRAVVPGEVRKLSRSAFCNTSCSEIIFENPDISVETDAFQDSEWIRRQEDSCIVGNLFYRLKHPMEKLVIPEGVKRFHETAFWYGVPEILETPLVPPKRNLEDLGGRRSYRAGRCREIRLSSRRAGLPFGALRSCSSLEAVRVPEGHRKYRTVDGVVFSGDGKRLEFYPQGKEQKVYQVPDGVVKIGRGAFQEQAYLEEVRMPDSVTDLGMGAFLGCRSLCKVSFSENIREIPDASAYQPGGVFEGCGALKEAALPGKLQYLGSYAFFASGLRQIVLNEGLRQIGEYALAAKQLNRVSLPVSLERLGKGALFYVNTVEAYIGTARGLIPALNAVMPNYADKMANVEWHRAVVNARGRRGDRRETFLIPGSLKRGAAYHLEMAWNGNDIDYEEYDACLVEIQDGEEKLEFAKQGILRLAGKEDSPYTAYMKRSAPRIAEQLLDQHREKEFLVFLQQGYLSEAALSKLLKLTNQSRMTTCSAYILKYQESQGSRKKRRFVL